MSHSQAGGLRVAVLGLGEAGGLFARDLAAAGHRVRGYDPLVERLPAGVERAADARQAVDGAELVLSLSSARVAVSLAAEVAPALAQGALFADLNSAAPALKQELAGIVEAVGALFVDVALIAPVPGRGARTPSVVSGSGAERYARLLAAAGAPVTVVGSHAGAAAERKLLRSVFMKGLAASAIEALAAARAAGSEQWLHDEIAATLADADGALLTRLLEGSDRHAVRRVHEMEAAREMLDGLDCPANVTTAAIEWLERLAAAPAKEAAE